MDADRYLKPSDIRRALAVTIKSLEREIVDGRPRLVLYFEGRDKGLLLTRELYEDILATGVGPNKKAEDFFANEGNLQ